MLIRSDAQLARIQLVVSLREVDNLTFKEIGKVLGFSKQRASEIYHLYKNHSDLNEPTGLEEEL